jgi:uncharacterized membrane protein
MSKREKAFWILAYAVTAILTLLPFFQVGFTTADDFQYYNVAQGNWETWLNDARGYAENTGRFYFLATKYFYYVPYLIDNFAWAKFVQYSSLILCYLLFSYVVLKLFNSKKLGMLTFLLLISFLMIGTGWHYPPAAHPFYFPFSMILFLAGILLYVNYIEKKGYWRIILSALLFFLSFLFYENYLVFAVFFCAFVMLYHWRTSGFVNMLKDKSTYLELVPYVVTLVLYTACYMGYRYYLSHSLGNSHPYEGAMFAHQLNISNFFKILNKCTLYALPCSTYWLNETREMMANNSPLISGHYNNLLFILTHAPVVAYINALIQCGILWFLTHKADFKKVSWSSLAIGIVAAMFFAYTAHILIAITEKYNAEWAYWIEGYVTSFYSYFGIILTFALIIIAILKACGTERIRWIARLLCCVLLFAGSILTYYMNDLVSKEWKKSQNRVTTLQLIAEKGFPDEIPENALIYDEQLHHTSNHALSICNGTHDFEDLIISLSKRQYNFAYHKEDLLQHYAESPGTPLYFMQVTESKKNGELLMVFSHITHLDSCNVYNSLADEADIYYYSPCKNYTLMYSLYAGTDSVLIKSINVNNSNPHQKLTHVHLQEQGMSPLNFNISNLLTPSIDTLWLP